MCSDGWYIPDMVHGGNTAIIRFKARRTLWDSRYFSLNFSACWHLQIEGIFGTRRRRTERSRENNAHENKNNSARRPLVCILWPFLLPPTACHQGTFPRAWHYLAPPTLCWPPPEQLSRPFDHADARRSSKAKSRIARSRKAKTRWRNVQGGLRST